MWHHEGSRHSRGYGAAWVKTRKRIIARDKGLCQPCLRLGRPTPFAAVDHIQPKADGGTDDDANLECICGPCHVDKTAAEAAKAQGRKVKTRTTFTADGRPIW